jgi:hypothetical protein
MPKRIVQNNNGGIFTIQLQGPKPSAEQKAVGEHTVQLGKALDLLPGQNMVDAAEWAEAKKNPTVKLALGERVPRSAAPEQDQTLVGRYRLVEGREVPDESPLAKMKPTEVLHLVEETLSVDTLGAWLQTEQRPELRKAIQKQIEEINAPMLGKGGALPPPGGDAEGGLS